MSEILLLMRAWNRLWLMFVDFSGDSGTAKHAGLKEKELQWLL